jgi:hypothetical protein
MPHSLPHKLSSTQQHFSKQRGGQRARNLKHFKETLHSLSGNDPIALISAYLQTPTGRRLVPVLWNTLEGSKLSSIASRVLEQHKQAPRQDRKRWLSILASVFTREELSSLGFSFSTSQFQKAHSFDPEVRAIRMTGKKRKPENSLEKETQELIKEHGYKRSRPSPNRTILIRGSETGQKERVAVRYLEDSKSSLFTEFKTTYSTVKVSNLLLYFTETTDSFKVSESSYRKYLPKELKKAKKETDKCPVCEQGKSYKRSLEKLLQNPEGDCSKITTLVSELKVVQIHQNLKTKQSAAFKKQKESLKEHEAIMILDFKENLKLGGGPVEVSSVFYSKVQRTVFTIALITKSLNREQYHYFDFVSDILTHNTAFVIDCVNSLFNSKVFTDYNIKRISVWTDGGPAHFRTLEYCYFMDDLKGRGVFEKVEWNYFIEYHGKNICDSHFAHISGIIKEFERQGTITSTDHLIQVLRTGFRKMFDNSAIRDSVRKKPQNSASVVTVFHYCNPSTKSTSHQLQIKNFKCWYSFQSTDTGVIVATFAGDEDGHLVPRKYKQIKYSIPEKRGTPVQNATVSLATYQKRANIRQRIVNEHKEDEMEEEDDEEMHQEAVDEEEDVLQFGVVPMEVDVAEATPAEFMEIETYSH